MKDVVLRVAPEQLLLASEEIQSSAVNMENLYGQLNNLIQNTESYWSGPASEHQRASLKKQMEQLNELIGSFTSHADTLFQLSGNYTQTQTSTKSEVETLRSDVIV